MWPQRSESLKIYLLDSESRIVYWHGNYLSISSFLRGGYIDKLKRGFRCMFDKYECWNILPHVQGTSKQNK